MHPKPPTIKKLRRTPSKKLLLMGASIGLWIGAGALLVKVVQGMGTGQQAEQTGFEEAFELLSGLEENQYSYAPMPVRSRYGISQAVYDGWRNYQRQPPQSVANISLEEAQAIYQYAWNEGDCAQHAAPLDMVCLDSVISFGVEGSQSFFIGLPNNPEQAALTVAQRREAYRYQMASGYARVQAGRQALMEGIERDRALAALVESYTSADQEESSFDRLLGWLGFAPDDRFSEPERPSEPVPLQEQRPDEVQPQRPITPLSPDQIYEQAKPFTVEVWITTNGVAAPAAGIILTEDGLILTNHHVIKDSFDFVRTADGQDYEGVLVETDAQLDLALIQLRGASRLPVANWAKASSHIQVGDTVYAIGSPNGENWKMTQDPVIAVQSECGIPGLECIRTPQGFLNPGNSGGPLLDQYGQVVGVNRAIQQRTREGVSIPVETVEAFVNRVQASRR